jgi:hypothetical protein
MCLSTRVACAVIRGVAQQVPAVPNMNDPRVGLKAGLFDAGEAAKNMEHISNLPKPDGFFDPNPPQRASQPTRTGRRTSGRARRRSAALRSDRIEQASSPT